MTEFRFPRPEDREAIIGLWEEAFGDSREFVEGFLASGYAPERCRVALESGKLLGMLFWFRCARENEPFAYIYAVATAASARGKGICTDLMEDTHRILAEQGYAGAVLCPGEPSLFRFYEKRGYSPLGTATEALVKAHGSLSAEVADADSYGAKRAALFPAGGVAQEGDWHLLCRCGEPGPSPGAGICGGSGLSSRSCGASGSEGSSGPLSGRRTDSDHGPDVPRKAPPLPLLFRAAF